MTEFEKPSVPKPDWKDKGHAVVRAGLGSIPVVGAAATELFQMFITPSLEKRRVEWMNSVADSLKELEDKGRVRIEDLKSNDAFVDTILQASQAAFRNSRQEKREALRNAVLNAALPSPPDESRQQMFLEWIDSLTVWHLRVFALLADPVQWFKNNHKQQPEFSMTSSLAGLLTLAYPELGSQRPLYDQIARDLNARGLTATGDFYTNMSGSGALAHRATELGRDFLKFITAPAGVGS